MLDAITVSKMGGFHKFSFRSVEEVPLLGKAGLHHSVFILKMENNSATESCCSFMEPIIGSLSMNGNKALT